MTITLVSQFPISGSSFTVPSTAQVGDDIVLAMIGPPGASPVGTTMPANNIVATVDPTTFNASYLAQHFVTAPMIGTTYAVTNGPAALGQGWVFRSSYGPNQVVGGVGFFIDGTASPFVGVNNFGPFPFDPVSDVNDMLLNVYLWDSSAISFGGFGSWTQVWNATTGTENAAAFLSPNLPLGTSLTSYKAATWTVTGSAAGFILGLTEQETNPVTGGWTFGASGSL